MPLAVALMVTLGLEATLLVLTVNWPVRLPAGMVMLAGVGTTLGLLLVKLTVMLLGAALAAKVTVPVTLLPPTTELELSLTALTPMGVTVSLALLVMPLRVAVILPVVVLLTAEVGILKPTLSEPAGTVTVEGTLAAALVLARLITSSVAAVAESVTVPVVGRLPVTVEGLTAMEAVSKLPPEGGIKRMIRSD